MTKKCEHKTLVYEDAAPWPEIPGAYSIQCANCGSHVTRILENKTFRAPISGELLKLMKLNRENKK